MSRTKPAAEAPETTIECGYVDCDVRFAPQRSTAKYHSATCRQRARRQRIAAQSEGDVPTDPDTGDAEHSLVRAVRKELAAADATDTIAGQLALQLARRAADPSESSLSALSKQILDLVAKAAGGKPDPTGPAKADPAPAPDDEVTQARRRREEIAQAAAAEAEA